MDTNEIRFNLLLKWICGIIALGIFLYFAIITAKFSIFYMGQYEATGIQDFLVAKDNLQLYFALKIVILLGVLLLVQTIIDFGFAIKLNKPKTQYIILLASAIIITILGIVSIALKIFINWSPIIIGMLIGGDFLARMLMAKKIFNIRYRNCKDWFKKVQTK